MVRWLLGLHVVGISLAVYLN
jgi:phosphatidylserine decarboxylase